MFFSSQQAQIISIEPTMDDEEVVVVEKHNGKIVDYAGTKFFQ